MQNKELYKQLSKIKSQKKGISSYLKTAGFSEQKTQHVCSIFRKARNSTEFSNLFEKTSQATQDLLNSLEAKETQSEEIENNEEWACGLKFADNYVYNKESDQYVVYLKAANGNVVLPGSVVRSIFENYSNWYGNSRTINEICRNYKIPRNYFEELKAVFGITHDSEPITPEQLLSRDVDLLAEDIVQKKKFQLYQKVQKRTWKETEEAARRWHEFMESTYNPFEEFLKTWQPPKYIPVAAPKGKKSCSKALVVGLSDIHYGAFTAQQDSFRNIGNSTKNTITNMEQYAKNIAGLVSERTYNFSECVIAGLGDILHTTGRGYTVKGTPLIFDCVKEEQFDVAFNSLAQFISQMLEIFPKVRVKSVKGNHNDFGDYVLFKALQAYFRKETRIEFEVYRTEQGLFKVNNTLFVISHGYNAEYPGRLPTAGKKRESYIASLFLTHPEKLIGVKTKVLLTADQHHYESKEYAEFEHHMLSTMVPNDSYSEAMGMKNVAKQSCFVVDGEGISEVLFSYVSTGTPQTK